MKNDEMKVEGKNKENMKINIIGIDFSTNPNKVGLALGFFSVQRTKLKKTQAGCCKSIAQTISEWISDDERVLIAIDAPLGWPEELGNALINHHAGQILNFDPNNLFRRTTDKIVKQRVGKQPLDVGSNLIARAAHAALKLIDELRQIKGNEIPLIWKNKLESHISVIEVYPAGTLMSYGIRSSGYKGKEDEDLKKRKEIIDEIRKIMDLPLDVKDLEENADTLDAVICVLAAHDFLIGDIIKPINIELARKEGWIWVKNPTVVKSNRNE